MYILANNRVILFGSEMNRRFGSLGKLFHHRTQCVLLKLKIMKFEIFFFLNYLLLLFF